MPDHGADATMRPEAAGPGAQEKPVGGEHPAQEPLVRCPACGADVVPREGSYGVNEPSVGLVCASCGAVISEASQ